MVTRYQHGAPEEGSIPQAPTIDNTPMSRVVGGVARFTPAFDGEPATSWYASHQVARDGTAGGSVVDTLDYRGTAMTVELIPGDPSTRTNVALALREGLIEEYAPGKYRDKVTPEGKQATYEVPEAPKQEGPGQQPQYFDAEDDALWAREIEPLPQHAYDAATASVVAFVTQGHGSFEDTAKALAQNAGIEPALAQEYVQAGYAHYERSVAAALKPMGLEGARLQEFYDWARGQQGLHEAVSQLAVVRNMEPFKALAVTFKRTNPGDISAYTNAGFQTHVDQTNGDLLVRHGTGNWVRAADLAK